MKTLRSGYSAAVLFFALSAYGQAAAPQLVTFSAPAGQSLVQALQDFRTKTTFGLTYSKEELRPLHIRQVSCNNIPPDSCLRQITAGLPVAVRTRGSQASLQYEAKNTPAQTSGRLAGKIVDEAGNPVAGAEVSVGAQTLTTDNNGDFAADLPAGSYTLTVRMSGYNSLRVEQLAVKADETNSVSFVLTTAKTAGTKVGETAIKEVVIRGTRKADTQAGLLTQQKKAAQMSDGISAEQIAKTPDSDVGGTLKRVTGVTTVDNKYVVVRSMGERWNTAAMDGVNLPSTDAYSNGFSFDIIPTAMVESVVVSKTATPDMNANFTGGYVEVKTKDIPNQDFLTVGMGTSFNSVSTFKDFLTKQRGKNDYWGFDDGTRDFPKGLEPMDWTNPLFFEQSKQFKNDNFTTYKTTADPGSNFQIAGGKSFDLGKNGNRFGFAGAITMRHEEKILDILHTERGDWMQNSSYLDDKKQTVYYNFRNQGASYNYNSTLAGMLNFGLQLGKSRISVRNAYTHIFDNTLTRTTGWLKYKSGFSDPSGGESAYNFFYYGILPEGATEYDLKRSAPIVKNTNYPIFKTLIQNKIEGNHKLGNVELQWFGAHTNIASDTKDYTVYDSFWGYYGKEWIMTHGIYNMADYFYRGYTENRETDYNYGASVKWQFNLGNVKNDLKLGYAGAYKDNTNAQRRFFLKVDENRNVPNNEKSHFTMFGSLADWFDGSHYVPGGIGWQTRPRFKDAAYKGKVLTHSPFIMFDNRWNQFRLVWGLRGEYFKYDLLSQQIDEADQKNLMGRAEPVKEKLWQWMPSANFTYSPTAKTNLRLAYSKSVIRPQFNERTGVPYLDPLFNAEVYNSHLQSSIIHNYDFKFEWFPSLGEILSAGVYYKDIDKPIERIGYLNNPTDGALQLYNLNTNHAKLLGFEVEANKSLGFLWKGSFLENLYIYGNFAYNKTTVSAFSSIYPDAKDNYAFDANRPLFGQTPWAYNIGLTYTGERLGLSFMYNAKGDQYNIPAYDYYYEEIQRPYAVADAQISYKMLKDKNLELKLNAKNIFDEIQEYYTNEYSYKTVEPGAKGSAREIRKLSPGTTTRYDKGIDAINFRAKNGRSISFSVGYTF